MKGDSGGSGLEVVLAREASVLGLLYIDPSPLRSLLTGCG